MTDVGINEVTNDFYQLDLNYSLDSKRITE